MSFDESRPCYRITSSMMGSYVNNQVIMIGKLHSLAPDQTSMKINCTDGSVYLAQLSGPPQGYWPPNSLIELQGVPQSRTVLKAFHFNQVPAQMAENFDSELYNETIKLLGSEYNTNSIMISDVSEHFGGSSEHDLSLISKPMQGRSDGAGRLEQSFHM